MIMSTHPTDDLLLHYVTGGLPRPFSVLVASHLAFCARCRVETERLEAVGGGLFVALEARGEAESGLEALLARLDEPVPIEPPLPPSDTETSVRLPAPLRAFIRKPLKSLSWHEVLRGISIVDLASIKADGARARLVLTRRGLKVPRHIHDGTELTLVLSGGLTAEQGHFRRGDVMVVEPSVVHRPVMDDDEDCLCLAVTDGAVRFTGLIGRARQLLAGY